MYTILAKRNNYERKYNIEIMILKYNISNYAFMVNIWKTIVLKILNNTSLTVFIFKSNVTAKWENNFIF